MAAAVTLLGDLLEPWLPDMITYAPGPSKASDALLPPVHVLYSLIL